MRRALLVLIPTVIFLFAACLGVAQGGGGLISGTVFLDSNGDGVHDEGESPLVGWQVTLSHKGPEDPVVVKTNQQGRYAFDNVPAGHYRVVAELDPGMKQTVPGGSGAYDVDLEPGQQSLRNDFGYEKPCISIVTKSLLCSTDGTGNFTWTFTVTNLATFPISHIFFLQPAPPVTVCSNLTNNTNYIPVNPPIPPGGSQSFTVTIKGALPGQQICWYISVHNDTHNECCATQFCIRMPDCRCFQFLEESVICDPATGAVQYCFTIQSLINTPSYWLLITGPPGVTINPNIIPLPPLLYGQTYSGCITLTGVAGGQQVCLTMSLHDKVFNVCCGLEKCIDIPDCKPGCQLQPGVCYARKPNYQTPDYVGFNGTVAAVTCWGYFQTDAVLAIQNLDAYQSAPPTLGQNWLPAPLGYHGPGNIWNRKNLGTIFALTYDNLGNIYVCHSSAFTWAWNPGDDQLGPGGAGAVYKIDAITGLISTFVGIGSAAASSLPNVPDPRVQAWNPFGLTDSYPGLGDITYDYDNNQLFVTNMEDGKIYRLDMLGNVVGSFDPLGLDGGTADPGFAPLGERLWAVKYHRGRLYYSVWSKDAGPSTYPASAGGGPRHGAQDNQIRSVAINAPASGNPGDFTPGSDRQEITTPVYPNRAGLSYSNPCSDISFSPEGYLGVAERGMDTDTSTTPHQSRGMEFRCDPLTGQWALFGAPADNAFSIGLISGQNTAGGLDYDYNKTDEYVPGKGRRVWWTGDCLGGFTGNPGCEVYGIQGVPVTGGDAGAGPVTGSILQDVTGVQDGGKNTLGDIEIPCPSALPLSPVSGLVILQQNIGPMDGEPVEFQLLDAGSVVDTINTTIDAAGHYSIAWNHTGNYTMRAKGRHWLSKKTAVSLTSGGSVGVDFSLPNGDALANNMVDLPDLNTVLVHFFEMGHLEEDLDCSGIVDLYDLTIVLVNFTMQGE